MHKNKVLIVSGPTASGKSLYALELAQKCDGVILNSDSLQLYEGLPLLTAQPTREEKERVPHHLYEIFPPCSALCSAGQWVARVGPLIAEVFKRGQVPLIVGGSGFYIAALTQGLSPIPPVSREIYEELKLHPLKDLYAQLVCVDPVNAERLVSQDRQRVIRALAVWQATQKPLSYWQMQPRLPLPYVFKVELLMPERGWLWKRIEERLWGMVKAGVFEEVRTFMERMEKENFPSSPLTRTLGFQSIKAFWEGSLAQEQAIQQTLEKTRQYAKRQLTWFRHQGKKG